MNPGTAQRMKDLRTIAADTIAHGQATSRQLEEVINGVDGPLHDAGRAVEDAVAQLESALEAYQFHLDKISRLVNTTQGNPGLMQALQAQPYDETLRAAAKEINGQARVWGDLQKTGSTPQKIVKMLSLNWPAYFGSIDGPNYKLDSYYHGRKETGFWYRKPYQKIGSRDYPTTPTLAGDLLGAEVMRVMKIPNESDMQKAQAKPAGPVDQASSRPSRTRKKGGGGSSQPATQKRANPPSRVAGKRPSRAKKKAASLSAAMGIPDRQTLKDLTKPPAGTAPAAAAPTPITDALRRALHSVQGAESRWDELWEKGATDDELAAAIAKEWAGNPGHSEKGMRYECRGTKAPLFIFGREGKTKIGGEELITRARQILQIPIPAAEVQALHYGRWLEKVNEITQLGLTEENANPGYWRDWFDNGVTPERAAKLWEPMAEENALASAYRDEHKASGPAQAEPGELLSAQGAKLDALQRLLYQALHHHEVTSKAVWPPLVLDGATDAQIVEALHLVWGRDSKFSGAGADGKYDINLKKRRVILRIESDKKQIVRTLEDRSLISGVRLVLAIPTMEEIADEKKLGQQPSQMLMGMTPQQEKAEARRIGKALLKKANGHAAPDDPASIEAGAFAGA